MLAGLQSVVVTIGACVAPTEIGPLPDHIRVEQFISQELILPECDLVVSHGGSGSLMGAFARGLPSVLLPLGADQPTTRSGGFHATRSLAPDGGYRPTAQ
ncbi:nucleotide disphospho-sugar-binding domain-containing protein [Streptomyces sp. NRRL S-1824]|uniref:glycosyltransferase n=1 Tax=Streptomyces sp. NRRL S-1824 TaxID=1463889 RepID=UPI0004C4B78C